MTTTARRAGRIRTAFGGVLAVLVLATTLVPTTAGAAPAPDGDRYTSVSPVRVLDTRVGTGGHSEPLEPSAPIDLVLAGTSVPADATAVVLNVTAVAPSDLGNIRVFPTPVSGDAVPLVSNLNVREWTDQPNLVTVRLGAGGAVRFAIERATADVAVDLAGYYSPAGATAYTPVSPVRAMDLRDGTGGVEAGRLGLRDHVDLLVRGKNGVPADATAVVLNVTAVAPFGPTNIRVYPRPADGASQVPPEISNLNPTGNGEDQPNLVTVQIGAEGKVRFYNYAYDTFLVADLAGYYSPTGGQLFTAVDPSRIADTRSGLGIASTVRAGVIANLEVRGVGGVPADATAVVLNVTAASPRGTTNIRVFPYAAGGAVPLISNLNVNRAVDEPNLVIVPVGEDGKVSFYTQSFDTEIVVDVQGYFAQ